MVKREVVISAIEMLNKIKHTAIEPSYIEVFTNRDGTKCIRASVVFNTAPKKEDSRACFYFNEDWFTNDLGFRTDFYPAFTFDNLVIPKNANIEQIARLKIAYFIFWYGHDMGAF